MDSFQCFWNTSRTKLAVRRGAQEITMRELAAIIKLKREGGLIEMDKLREPLNKIIKLCEGYKGALIADIVVAAQEGLALLDEAPPTDGPIDPIHGTSVKSMQWKPANKNTLYQVGTAIGGAPIYSDEPTSQPAPLVVKPVLSEENLYYDAPRDIVMLNGKNYLNADFFLRWKSEQIPPASALLAQTKTIRDVRDKLWKAAKLSMENGWLGNLGDSLNALLDKAPMQGKER